MSSDGEGRARSSVSPAKRRHSGGSEESEPPRGALGGNNSDNDAGSLGSDTGKMNNNDDEDLFGSESEGGDDKYVKLDFSNYLETMLMLVFRCSTDPLEDLTIRNSTPGTMKAATIEWTTLWITNKAMIRVMDGH